MLSRCPIWAAKKCCGPWKSTASCAPLWPPMGWRRSMTDPSTNSATETDIQRWRLVLGRFAEPRLGGCGGRGSKQSRMDRVLDYLYGREYRGRGVRDKVGGQSGSKAAAGDGDSRHGGDAESLLSVPEWIHEVRELFPNDTAEIIQRHALDR